MKYFIIVIPLILAAVFGAFGTGYAGGKLNLQHPGVQLKILCPAGWTMQPHSAGDEGYVCVPKKPEKKIQCPPKTEYFETDCTIGCKAVAY